jgi:putative ABC transport system permease protein
MIYSRSGRQERLMPTSTMSESIRRNLLRETKLRSIRAGPWVETLVQDGRFGLRMLLKSPGFTVVAVLTLALGIGASTAIFTLLNAVLYRELPVPHPEQLVELRIIFHNGQHVAFTLPIFQELQRDQQVFSEMSAWSGGGAQNVEIDGKLARNNVLYASGSYFSELGQRPLLGRFIEPADANPSGPISRVAVISYGFWQARFAGSPGVIGRQILVENQPFTIVGVTHKAFSGLYEGTETDITVPFTAYGLDQPDLPFPFTSGHLLWLSIMGRLKYGVSIAQARAQLTNFWPRMLAEIVPPDETGERRQQYLSMGLYVTSAAHGPGWDERARYWRPLYYLMGMVALMLLAVCVNVACLMLARGAGRVHETSVRLALGATPGRVAAQTLVEGFLLSFAGALFGLALGFWGARWMFALLTRLSAAPVLVDLRPDFHILAFTAGVAVAIAVLFGLVPALRASRSDPGTLLRQESPVLVGRSGRLGQILIVAQISLSVMLVLASALFTRTFWNLRSAAPGFDRNSVLNDWLLARPGAARNLDLSTYYHDLTDRLKSLPGVRAAGLGELVPGGGQTPSIEYVAPVSASSVTKGPISDISYCAPGFFDAIGMTVLRGRDFAWSDGPHQSRVAVISLSLAKRLFGDGNPIGAHVNIGTFPDHQNLEIVGVVSDARLYNPRDAHPLSIFLDPLQFAPAPQAMMSFVRAAKNPLGLSSAISRIVDSLGYQFVSRSTTLEEAQAQALIEERLSAIISGFFAALGLILACVGLYGLVAQSVARRTREIGIRMALGAQPANILTLVLIQALVLSIAGIALGVLFSLAASRLVAAMLYGVSPNDAPSIIATSLALLLIGLLAAYVPARRATRINPMSALRHE